MIFDERADFFEVYFFQIIHEDNALRIAHRQTSHFEHVASEVQRVRTTLRPAEK